MTSTLRVYVGGLLAMAGILFVVGTSFGQIATNAVASGNWSNAATWDNGEPTDAPAGDKFAAINGGHTVTINMNGESAPFVDLGTIVGQTGTLNIEGGDLTVIDSTPGTEPNFSSIRVGQLLGSSGTLSISGGVVVIDGPVDSPFAVGELMVGDQGAGVMTMTGGSLSASDEVFIGLGDGSSGELTVSGGTLDVLGRNLLVGFGGSNGTLPGADAKLNISGNGEVNVAGFLFSSFFDGADSTMTQTGGTLNVGAAFVQGRRGNSSFNHSGGSITVTTAAGNGDFVVGDGGSNNVYNISGTATVDAGRDFLVGVFGDAVGDVNQSGGTITVGQHLRVGIDGIGTFTQSAGEMNVTGSVFLGDFDSSNGTYKISDGTLDVMGNFSVGGALASNAAPDRVEPDGMNGAQGQALDANGTLTVSGSASTITIGGNFLANPDDKSPFRSDPMVPGGDNSATLVLEIFGNSGTSLIDVAGVADLDGAIVDLDLMGGFTPTVGQTFDLLAASSFGSTGTGTTENVGTGEGFALAAEDTGVFSLSVVPALGGEVLRATFLAPPMGVAGDYNQNGVVDGADYVVWRDLLGMNVALPNETETPGSVTPEDYTVWRSNFGNMVPGSGALTGGTVVPEPATPLLVIGPVAAMSRYRRRKRS